MCWRSRRHAGFVFTLMMIVLLTACAPTASGEGDQTKSPDVSHHSGELANEPEEPSPHADKEPKQEQALAKKAKEEIGSFEHVTDVKAVSLADRVYIVPDVKHRVRWNLQEFRHQARNHLKTVLPDDARIKLSTDMKVRLELEKLERDIENSELDGEQLDKRLQNIEDFMKG